MTLRFALLGAGRIGKVHARAVASNPQAKLVAVADAFEKAAAELASAYGAEVRTIDAIEKAKDIDAVIICTPTDTHADLIERFAKAGKAIFCEKPIDLSVERVEKCLAVVEKTGATLMVGFNRRFDPHFAAVRKAIDDGAIGTVEMVTITSRDPGAPPLDYIARSGGIFRDMTIHDFDMARFLLGEEPVAVSAHASVLVDKKIGDAGDFDSVSVILETASGKQAVISNSRRATYGYDQRIEVHGSKGMVSAENQRPVSIELANDKGYTRPPLHDFFMTRSIDAYANEIARAFGLDTIVAFGHSVGGGMAIATAARWPDRCAALVTESAQSFVEDRTRAGLQAARVEFARPGQLERLARYHGAKARWVLDAWIETWLSPEFADWHLDDDLARVRCPALAIHDDQDEYGSAEHPGRIARLTHGPARAVILEGCGHVPHREQPARVLAEVAGFLASPSGDVA